MAAAILFCGFLAVMALSYLLPQKTFSDSERRYLAQMPKFQWKTVSTGKWGGEVETYLTDHVLGRDLLVGINAYMEYFAGRQQLKDIWVVDEKLVEAPVAVDEAAIARNMNAINAFAESVGQPIDLMVVPSAGWASGDADYTDADALARIAQKADSGVRMLSVQQIFEGRPELYYNTDHHWTRGLRCLRMLYECAGQRSPDKLRCDNRGWIPGLYLCPQCSVADPGGIHGALAGKRRAYRHQRRDGRHPYRHFL